MTVNGAHREFASSCLIAMDIWLISGCLRYDWRLHVHGSGILKAGPVGRCACNINASTVPNSLNIGCYGKRLNSHHQKCNLLCVRNRPITYPGKGERLLRIPVDRIRKAIHTRIPFVFSIYTDPSPLNASRNQVAITFCGHRSQRYYIIPYLRWKLEISELGWGFWIALMLICVTAIWYNIIIFGLLWRKGYSDWFSPGVNAGRSVYMEKTMEFLWHRLSYRGQRGYLKQSLPLTGR